MRSTRERTSMRKPWRLFCIAAALVAAVVIAGWGGSASSSSSSGGSSSTSTGSGSAPKKGGTVTVMESAGGVDSLDPGYWYYQTDYEDVGSTTQRTLSGFGPTDT